MSIEEVMLAIKEAKYRTKKERPLLVVVLPDYDITVGRLGQIDVLDKKDPKSCYLVWGENSCSFDGIKGIGWVRKKNLKELVYQLVGLI